MSDNPYHDHLDACARCRNRPFDLCPDGARILRDFAVGTADRCVNGFTREQHLAFDSYCRCDHFEAEKT